MSELTFEREAHVYRLDGRHVPHVTGILTGLGLVDGVRHFTEESRRRGQAIHAAIHYHLEGDLDWASVAERFKPYVEGAIRFLDDSKAVVEASEVLVVHEQPPVFAGTADVLGTFFGEPGIPDWKSGGLGEVAGLQTAGYDLAVGGDRRRRFGVQLFETGRYKLHDLSARENARHDYGRFLAAADLYTAFIWKGEPHVLAA